MAGRLTRCRAGVPATPAPSTTLAAPTPPADPQTGHAATPLAAVDLRDEVRRQVRLAWPVVLGMMGAMGLGLVDTAMVGVFGGEALAAFALATTWAWAVSIVARSLPKGLDPVVAQAFGAGDRDRAGDALAQGLAIALLAGAPVIALHLVAAPGLRLLGQPAELLPLAAEYCRILAPGVPFMLAFATLQQFLQALGIVRPVLAVVVVANVANVALNQLLMHGLPGVPGLGPLGCAWSSLLSTIAMPALLAWLVRGDLARWAPASWSGALRDRAALRRLVGLGLPVGLQAGVETWGFQAAGVLVGWLGTTWLAAHTIALHLASASFMVPLGISAAAATRVGNLVGAGVPWGRAAAVALALGAGAMTASAAAYTLVPEPLVRIFTTDPEVVACALLLLPIAAAFQLFDGLQAVGFGVLRGLADVRLPVAIGLVAFWLFGLPLGYGLAFPLGLGAPGVWIALALSLALVSVLLLARIRALHRRGVQALARP